MSRPRKTPIERAAAAVAAISPARRAALWDRVWEVEMRLRESEKDERRQARKAKGQAIARHVVCAQHAHDAARDVAKLLALLDAIGGAT